MPRQNTVCFESVDGEVQRKSEVDAFCVCGPGEIPRHGADRGCVVLHEEVGNGRSVHENSAGVRTVQQR